jgi:hypothetical protein
MSGSQATLDVATAVIVAEQHDGRLFVFQWRNLDDVGGASDWDAVTAQVGPDKRFRRCQAAEVDAPPDLAPGGEPVT